MNGVKFFKDSKSLDVKRKTGFGTTILSQSRNNSNLSAIILLGGKIARQYFLCVRYVLQHACIIA